MLIPGAVLPVTYAGRYSPVVTVEIQGQPGRMLLDNATHYAYLSLGLR